MNIKLMKKLISASLILLTASLASVNNVFPALASTNNSSLNGGRGGTVLGGDVIQSLVNGGAILGDIAASVDAKGQDTAAVDQKLSTQVLELMNAATSGNAQPQAMSQFSARGDFVPAGGSLAPINKNIGDQSHGDLAYVYVTVAPTAQTSIVDPLAWKVVDRDEKDHVVAALVAPEDLASLAALNDVTNVSLVSPPVVNAGSVTTQGDSILETDKVRALYGQGGAGIKVGVISDGVDHLSDAVASGDLPSNVTVQSNTVGGDEGTAILEIVHDMAPDASLYFHDSGTNIIAFDSAVDALVAAGVNVIVDDVSWIQEPYFQDGTVATHIASVLANNNIIYVSAAGNYAQTHFEGTYTPFATTTFNDFSEGASTSTPSLYVKMPPNATVTVVLQWDDAFGSSSNDYDLYLSDINSDPVSVVASSINRQTGMGSNPIEEITYTNTTGTTTIDEIDVQNFNNAAPKTLDVYIFPDANTVVFNNNLNHPSDSVFGQAAVPGVIAVGAIGASNTSTIEPYSSQGPVTILGQAQRTKPDIAGIDGVSVSGAGGFPTTFFGTSAAVGSIGAVAAQLWAEYPSSTSNQIRNHLLNTAVDLGAPGVDDVYGSGRADSLLAFNAGPSITSFSFASSSATGTINGASSTIGITVPFGTDVTTLAPTVAISGSSVAPASGALQNFTHPVTYTVTGADGLIRTYTVTVTVAAVVVPPTPVISVTTSTPATTTVGTSYTATVSATSTNATDTFTWTVGGTPSWMSLATTSKTLTLNGTSTATSTSNITISVKGANPSSTPATANYTLTVSAAVPPPAPIVSILTSSIPNATSGVAYSTHLIATSTNATDTFTWSIASGTLPNNINLATSTGIISGTPSSTGTSAFTVRVRGANPSSTPATANYILTVNAQPVPSSTDASLSSIAVNGTAISGFASSTLTYNVTLPAGTTSTPVVSATTTNSHATLAITQATSTAGSATILVTAQSGATQTYTVNFSVTVLPPNVISVTADPSEPASGTVTMGSTGNILGVYKFTETSNVENVNIKSLTITANSTSSVTPFTQLTLWNGSTTIATSSQAATSTGGFTYSFPAFSSSVIIPQASSTSLILKGDAVSFASLPQAASTTFVFKINATSSVTAVGVTSNKSTTVSSVAGASGNSVKILSGITFHTITASAGAGGTISPSGTVSVADGASQTFTITANPGFDLNGKVVDGVNIGGQLVSPDSFTFTNVTSSHTIVANFLKSALATVAVTPATSTILVGATEQLTAVTSDQAGLPFAASTTWSSNNTSTATVDAHGLVTALAPGITTITAASGTASTTTLIPALVTVLGTPIAITPATLPDGQVGSAYSQTIVASDTNASDTFAWTIATDTLSADFTITTSTISGVTIAGTPTGTGSYQLTVTAASIASSSVIASTTENYTLTVDAAPAPVAVGGGGGGGGGGYSAPITITTVVPTSTIASSSPTQDQFAPGVGQVLGASVFNFTTNLQVGMSGNAVTQLQDRLTEEGVYSGPITGYFGQLTLAAVKAYQTKHNISPASGFVGPLTRAQLNSGNASVVTSTSTTSGAASLQAEIAALQAQVAALLALLAQRTASSTY